MKIEMGGKGIAMISNVELEKMAEGTGKKADKARMELIKRKGV